MEDKQLTERFRMLKSRKTAILLAVVTGVALAAATFTPNSQPFGYIAAPALSSTNFKTGNVVAYTPWFETSTYKGDVIALPVGTNGVVSLLSPKWRASIVIDGQHYDTGRKIVTSNGANLGVPFRYDDLTAAQQSAIGSEEMLNFVRGDRSNEGGIYRERASVLGDIIHTTPVYVGKPVSGYTFGGYLAFAASHATRPARVFASANDGMVHALDAETGTEVFAYVPSMIMDKLPRLADSPYQHRYLVDGFMTAEDAETLIGGWRTVLVGGLGAGGKGFFALDVTEAGAASEDVAAAKVLWEFHAGSVGSGNLGYSYGRPSIAKLNSGRWAAIVPNGYLSSSGAASLYVIDVETGLVLRELVVPDSNANGLSSPTLRDVNGDHTVDVVYAGDLNGNVWKFDLTSGLPLGWAVANGGTPLFQTPISGTARQAITTAPEVGRHPDGGVMVYVGTGRLFSSSDGADKSTQAVYGIWDNDGVSGPLPVPLTSMVQQRLRATNHSNGSAVRTATNNPVDWSVHRGWYTPIEIENATALDKGERVLQDILLRDGRISLLAVNPTIGTGDNWYVQLDALSGGAPDKTIVDINGDYVLDVADNVDGNGDGVIADVPVDRVVGEYQNFGLASRPVIGSLSTTSDSALINHLAAIPPNQVVTFSDPGLFGGHFDLDTASAVYPFNGGSTDAHVHEWDDKYDSTTIDYFDIIGDDGLADIDDLAAGAPPNTPFLITVANDELSPGGILEINGTSISVGDYRALLDRYLADALLPGESFPLYKLTDPTLAEQARGVVKLTSFKLSFDAFAIVSGDLIPTKTGCVRGNDPGAKGEYRNGALMLQALDASAVAGGFVFDPLTQRYVAGSTAIKAGLGYATEGLFWESTVFWHWDGPCYGEADFAPLYESCIIQGGGECIDAGEEKKDKGKKKKKKKDDDEPTTEGGGTTGGTSDPGHSVTNTTIGGDNDTGRLFWRELIPEE